MPDANSLAVLISGGLDSAIVLGLALQADAIVHPLFVRCGLSWETVELEHLRRFLNAVDGPSLRPLRLLDLPVADLYGNHWSLTGREVPQAGTPDDAVFLPGRNVLLLAKGLLWCHLHRVPAIALGVLQTNPFPDATPSFFRGMQEVVNQAVGGTVQIRLPLAGLTKKDVMQRGSSLPLGLTFSCIHPVGEKHCGRCNKCDERQHAFAEAGMVDPTAYVFSPSPPGIPGGEGRGEGG